MRRAVIIILSLILIAFPLAACAPGDGDYLAYQHGAREITVRGETGGSSSGDYAGGDFADSFAFSAVITLGAQREDGGRDVSITFSEPESLRGIRVAEEGGGIYLTLGDMRIPAAPENVRGMLDIAGLFMIDGSLDRVEKIKPAGGVGARNLLYISTDEGEYRISEYRVLLDVETAVPLRIEGKFCGREIMVDILEFK